jgi:aminoglycoside/choline kinase family phosphotransferase
MDSPDLRRAGLAQWLENDLGLDVRSIEVASADASFRRYFRAHIAAPAAGAGHTPGSGHALIVMDAPPDKEDLGPYLKVSGLLAALDVHVPRIHATDRARGYVLLEDLGSTQYLAPLREPGRADALYSDALDELAKIQVRGTAAAQELPPYDAAVLLREMRLMPEWFLGRHLGVVPDDAAVALLERAFAFLCEASLAQPAVFVHRDYHSRNLMLLPTGNPGVIDFQDALRGPVGYDLVSLLKDCYISWPRARVEGWVGAHRERLLRAGFTHGAGRDSGEFLRWFDLVGVQRHIKVLGIFARLWHRDGKLGYLDDLPLTLHYVLDTCARYVELAPLHDWLQARVVPALPAATAAAKTAAAQAAR